MATRFLFDPPRRPKTRPGLNIKSLLVRCPSTSKLIDTGQTMEQERWATAVVKIGKLKCTHCDQMHAWAKKDVILGRPLR